MQIIEWNLQDIEKLTGYYNQQCECLPFSYPLTPSEFEVGIQNEGWQLDGSRIFVAKESRETLVLFISGKFLKASSRCN